MSDTTSKKRKPQTSLELTPPLRGALRRLKQIHGINYKAAFHRGVMELEARLNKGVEV